MTKLFIPKLKSPPYGPWQKAFTVDALRRAWASVRANRGSGNGSQTIAEFEREQERYLKELHEELIYQRYRPQPVKQILVPKGDQDWRPLTLWAIRDRVVQRAAYNYLAPVFDRQFLPCSFGFRRGRSTRDVAEAIQDAYAGGARWVLDADIKDCFGQMKNGQVLRQLARWRVPGPLRELIRRWLRAKIGNAWRPDQIEAGASQGNVISPLLCNLYLHPFDKAMQKPGVQLIRYADDFVILSRHKAAVRAARHWAGINLKRLGLQLHAQKTHITSFEEGFRFVGWFFVRDEMYELR